MTYINNLNLRFEKITLDNCEEAVKIYDENHNLNSNYSKLKEQIIKLSDNPDYYNIAVYIDDEIVGMFTAILNHDIVEELHPFLTVWNLGVSPKHRRKGIAPAMLEYIFALAKTLNCDFISLIAEENTIPAIELYKKSKYQEEVGFFKLVNKK